MATVEREHFGLSSKKVRKFDLGAADPSMLVKCKSHTWTSGARVSSGKFHAWNEAMLLFLLAPKGFRKILFAQREFNEKKGKNLAHYYIDTYSHLIPTEYQLTWKLWNLMPQS